MLRIFPASSAWDYQRRDLESVTRKCGPPAISFIIYTA
jgi:hypothetical protein